MDNEPVNITSDNEKPVVSIITACLNAEDTIEQTIQSVIDQTYPNIEYIIIDGGSTDKTFEIVKILFRLCPGKYLEWPAISFGKNESNRPPTLID